jgi:hypothetical protein
VLRTEEQEWNIGFKWISEEEKERIKAMFVCLDNIA